MRQVHIIAIIKPKRTVKRTKETSKKQQGEEEKADSASSIEPSVKKRRKVADKGTHSICMHAADDNDHVI